MALNGEAQVPTWIMTLIALGFFGALGGGAFLIHTGRRAGFEKLARRRGLTFHELAPDSLAIPASLLREIESGFIVHSKPGRAIEGEVDGARIAVVELLRYRADSRAGQVPYYPLIIAMLELAEAELPHFSLDPEKLRHKLLDLKKGKDIDFPDAPRFSGRYRLSGPDEAAIRDLFSPQLLDMLARHPGRRARCYGDRLVWYRPSGLLRWAAFRPGAAERILVELLEFRSRLS